MKFFTAFILCSFSGFSLALECSLDVELQCGKLNKKDWKGDMWPDNAWELNKACRSVEPALECQIAYAEQCRNSLYSIFLDYMRESKDLYRKLCSKYDTFRQKFLKHVPCLNENVDNLMQKCRLTTKVVVNKLCTNSDDLLRCVVQGIIDTCGSDASQVFDTLYKPTLSIDNILCKKSYGPELLNWIF